MTPILELKGIVKTFGETAALLGVDLEVEAGELVTLLGPSGCGKTTLLRIIAGFEDVDAGEVLIDGRPFAGVPPHRRPVNTVFQRYIMFPHLSVHENIAFGLRVAGVPKAEIGDRVREALALVRLEGYGSRAADELSGGQAQRISLARALVNRPRILLLDEPLSALDLKVRVEMQAELRRIHREVGTTFIYVTHDQQEAMALSDRVVVLNAGRIEQIAPPKELYHRPATPFVAAFVGDANVIAATVVTGGATGVVRLAGSAVELQVSNVPETRSGWIVLRPETLAIAAAGAANVIPGRVLDVAFLGASVSYRLDIGDAELRVIESTAGPAHVHAIGDSVAVAYDVTSCTFLAGAVGTAP